MAADDDRPPKTNALITGGFTRRRRPTGSRYEHHIDWDTPVTPD
ncbi:MAG TPA: hypothetical protein VGP31_08885 [Planosporangium sp.]|nr:hypothetical protein [Planosporangium sp.]